jgi:glycosyltransferase involved in cell wall biosynthesis
MKILLINNHANPGYGAENQMIALRKGLRQRGHDVRLLASSAQKTLQQEDFADYRCFGTPSRNQTLLNIANPWAFWQLRHVLREFKPDVVHVKIFLSQLSPLILPLLKGVPSIYYVVWFQAICPMGLKMLPDGTVCQQSAGKACFDNRCLPAHSLLAKMLMLGLWKKWQHFFDRIVTVSDAARRHLVAEGIRIDEVIWNSIPIRPPHPPLSCPPSVAFAGHLYWGKGADVLVHAFAKVLNKIPDARLVVAGDGPERSNLKALVAAYGLNHRVDMTGYLPRSEMERRFNTAWVQVVPGRLIETFGNVAAEAMMRGTAVVASNIGGPAEFIQNGRTGLLVPPGDENALAEALICLLGNKNKAEEMGNAGRQFALVHFEFESYLDKILLLYRQIVAAP